MQGGPHPPPQSGVGYPPQGLHYPAQIGAHPTSGFGGTAFHQPGPVIVYAQNEVDSVSDYFIANIIACLLCCWCVGCFAILKSHECQNAKRNHDVERARKLSHNAKNLLIATIVVGIICGIIGGVLNALNNAGLFAWTTINFFRLPMEWRR